MAKIISSNDTAIRDAFEPRVATSADPFHCLGPAPPREPADLTMFKIKACGKELRASVFEKIRDRFGENKLKWLSYKKVWKKFEIVLILRH